MSTIKVNSIESATGGGVDAKIASVNSGSIGNRNLVINGAMKFAQRSVSATGKTGSGIYATDRMLADIGSAGTWTISQDSESPDGFSKSTKFQCTTANSSLAAGAFLLFQYRFEGHDVQPLAKGTSGAKTFTVSFHVRSNKTGTYILGVNDRDNTRNNSKPYTISAANTWEKKTITFEADTTGALNDDNGESLRLDFWLGAGTNFTSGSAITGWEATTNANRAKNLSVNLADNTANNWYITGLQMEVGSVATEFEHKLYCQELAACQRYYESNMGPNGPVTTTDGSISSQWAYMGSQDSNSLLASTGIVYKATKRVQPTVTIYNPSNTATANRANSEGNEKTVTAVYGGINAAGRVYVSGCSAGDFVTYNWEASAEL